MQAGGCRWLSSRALGTFARIATFSRVVASAASPTNSAAWVIHEVRHAALFPCAKSSRGKQMKDMQTHLEKLRVQIAECEMIRDLATDRQKRELFAKLAEHFKVLAGEVEKAMQEPFSRRE